MKTSSFFNLLNWEKPNTFLNPKTILGFYTRGKFFEVPIISFIPSTTRESPNIFCAPSPIQIGATP